MGTDYWQPLLDQLRLMVTEKTIDPIDLDRLIVSDDPGEVVSGSHRHRDEAVRPDLRAEGETALVAAGDVREVVEATGRNRSRETRNPDGGGPCLLPDFAFRISGSI